ncbi:hypothetical protein [Hydrogenophaga intermedia]|uniref:Uncharacterized protein n=1 Tax=Hydrogenophaga intermedia TaxID=65786 RepID=A0A1L1PFH4_HYDIT|nr:hypothetical protein [Hydrogenophaga intermedia]TMU72422.1 hypothetical protein FGJ01_18785 [Hydrogenophaga intermedia]CDN87504.1 hypothetical protein BN948_01926 [Hydrogenophaga intermedia]
MSSFTIARLTGHFEHQGQLRVAAVGQCSEKKDDPFVVVLSHNSGPMSFDFHLTPDQSRRLRAALEEAEGKAEILTAAI